MSEAKSTLKEYHRISAIGLPLIKGTGIPYNSHNLMEVKITSLKCGSTLENNCSKLRERRRMKHG